MIKKSEQVFGKTMTVSQMSLSFVIFQFSDSSFLWNRIYSLSEKKRGPPPPLLTRFFIKF